MDLTCTLYFLTSPSRSQTLRMLVFQFVVCFHYSRRTVVVSQSLAFDRFLRLWGCHLAYDLGGPNMAVFCILSTSHDSYELEFRVCNTWSWCISCALSNQVVQLGFIGANTLDLFIKIFWERLIKHFPIKFLQVLWNNEKPYLYNTKTI